MLSRRAFTCPFCELKDTIRTTRFRSGIPWQPHRSASQFHKKRPARMTLSEKVSNSNVEERGIQRQTRRLKPSPFGAMNQTSAGIKIEYEKRRAHKKVETRSTNANRSRSDGFSKSKSTRKTRSEGEMKALKMQKSLTGVSYERRNKIKDRIDGVESFEEYPLLPKVQEAIRITLDNLPTLTPTPIQRLAIPAIVNEDTISNNKTGGPEGFLLAAETGSGKTLAYLIPVIDAIKRAEAEESKADEEHAAKEEARIQSRMFELAPPPLSPNLDPRIARPRVIVLLPSAELADQVGQVFKKFSHTVKLRVSTISAAYSSTVIRSRLFGPNGVDVVVSTPHLLSSIIEAEPNVASRVTHLVIDEADSLLDKSFTPVTNKILDRAMPSLKKLILCSATIPRALDSVLRNRFPDVRRLTTPNLHAIPRRVQLTAVDIERQPYQGNRKLACADAIYNIGKSDTDTLTDEATDTKHIIVFVNERETAVEVANFLVTKGIEAVALHRDLQEERRGEVLAAFTSRDSVVSNSRGIHSPKELGKPSDNEQGKHIQTRATPLLQNVRVLVMTDLGSRGIDTVAVRHVILYNVPHTTIDFIHRLGRIGRMGRRGRGVVLIGKDDRKDVVREVREAMFRGQALI